MFGSVTWTSNGACVEAKSRKIVFEMTHGEALDQSDASFSVWALLPLAMINGEDLHIDAEIDEAVLENATALSRIWEMWVPDRFAAVKVTASGSTTRQQPSPSSTNSEI